ncbi:MAG: hypothetical protein SGJ18_12085 [Pseudomonadota bacterium]|nr:hypothetical protein [Pseudomonadota bacterium]
MKFLIPLLATLSLLSSANAFKADQCIPKNNLHIPVGFVGGSGITEDQFNDLLDQVEKIYTPIFSGYGATFDLVRSWDDDTVNAQAWQTGKTWHIEMFGGLARHKETTADGMTLVACHEIGHHLGGGPKIAWASNEGQSDYFGSLKCLRKVWAKDDNEKIVSKAEIDPVAVETCEAYSKDANEVAICKRGAMAGMALGRLLSSLGGEDMPKFETPDSKVVKKTNNSHPAGQCRLDTYYRGSYCNVSSDIDVDIDGDDFNLGVCSRKYKDQEPAARPLCWYAEPKDKN